jgi:hypothetical protein
MVKDVRDMLDVELEVFLFRGGVYVVVFRNLAPANGSVEVTESGN